MKLLPVFNGIMYLFSLLYITFRSGYLSLHYSFPPIEQEIVKKTVLLTLLLGSPPLHLAIVDKASTCHILRKILSRRKKRYSRYGRRSVGGGGGRERSKSSDSKAVSPSLLILVLKLLLI